MKNNEYEVYVDYNFRFCDLCEQDQIAVMINANEITYAFYDCPIEQSYFYADNMQILIISEKVRLDGSKPYVISGKREKSLVNKVIKNYPIDDFTFDPDKLGDLTENMTKLLESLSNRWEKI